MECLTQEEENDDEGTGEKGSVDKQRDGRGTRRRANVAGEYRIGGENNERREGFWPAGKRSKNSWCVSVSAQTLRRSEARKHRRSLMKAHTNVSERPEVCRDGTRCKNRVWGKNLGPVLILAKRVFYFKIYGFVNTCGGRGGGG